MVNVGNSQYLGIKVDERVIELENAPHLLKRILELITTSKTYCSDRVTLHYRPLIRGRAICTGPAAGVRAMFDTL